MFQGKSFIVLGATAGLAQATLPWLLEQGGQLVLHGQSEASLQGLALEDGPELRQVAGDLQEPTLGARLWEAMLDLGGQPFGWLCFVGRPGRFALEEWTPENFAQLFALNTAAPLLLCRDWASRMKEHGAAGNAVVFSTMQTQAPFAGSLPYALSKGALPLGVEILAKEFGAPPAIRVNAIAPGVNEAGMALASIQRGKYQPFVDRKIIPRYGRPEDIRQALQFLLQPDLYMTGQTLTIDGGLILRREMGED